METFEPRQLELWKLWSVQHFVHASRSLFCGGQTVSPMSLSRRPTHVQASAWTKEDCRISSIALSQQAKQAVGAFASLEWMLAQLFTSMFEGNSSTGALPPEPVGSEAGSSLPQAARGPVQRRVRHPRKRKRMSRL